MDAAIKDYQQRSYGQAVQKFTVATALNPNNELAHYYLALCNQALHRRQEARSEYEWVTTHAKNTSLINNARLGLRALGEAASAPGGSYAAIAPTANAYFFTQINDPKWNRNAAQQTLNCGPTCLAMTFKRFEKYPSHFLSKDPQYLIEATRIMMTGSEEDTGTNCAQVVTGATKGGLKAERLDGIEAVDEALASGQMVISSGNPFVSGSYGHRVGFQPFNNGHFILVTGKSGGYYVVNDPYYVQGPINLSSGELSAFMSFWIGKFTGNAVAVGP
jgi:hypothetical protein